MYYYNRVSEGRSINLIDGRIFLSLSNYNTNEQLDMEDSLFQVVDKFNNNALLVNKV